MATVTGLGSFLAATSLSAAIIVNGASGVYEDSKGHGYGAASNRTSVSVAGVSADLVTPKETTPDRIADAVTRGTSTTKTFTITNVSNISDAYIISALTVNAGSVQSVVFQPTGAAPISATVGTTVSPTVPVGGSIAVAVTVSTKGAPVHSGIEVSLTARTTARSQNGPQSDTGTAWIWLALGPEISGIAFTGGSTSYATGPLPVNELVNGSALALVYPGATLNFTLPFTNIGDAPALGVVVTIGLPSQLRPTAASATLLLTDHRTGKSLTSDTGARAITLMDGVKATIPRLDPGVDALLSYAATTSSTASVGTTLADSATISAQSVTSVTVTPAIVFIGVINTVFDAIDGMAHPIAGAAVSIVDALSGQKVKLGPVGSGANRLNLNPFLTTSDGTFSFTLPSLTDRGTNDQLYVTAPGYLNRRIAVHVEPGADGLPTTTLTALDGMALAIAGGFRLTTTPVSVVGVTGFLGNVPLFSSQALRLSLAANRSLAGAGDQLGLAIDFGPGNQPLAFPAVLSIQLPPGVVYAHGSARIAGVAQEPVITGQILSWPVKGLAQHEILTFDTVLLPAVVAGTTLEMRARLALELPGASQSIDADVAIVVTGGALTARTVLSGRVFSDLVGDGHFAPGDTGIASVRIFLEDGESVLTDHDGRFSFPAARPGMHVLRLDPMTLPTGMHAYHGFPVNDPRSSIQLVHGIFDSQLMSDVNFALSDRPDR